MADEEATFVKDAWRQTRTALHSDRRNAPQKLRVRRLPSYQPLARRTFPLGEFASFFLQLSPGNGSIAALRLHNPNLPVKGFLP
jgi:hypothetical protein